MLGYRSKVFHEMRPADILVRLVDDDNDFPPKSKAFLTALVAGGGLREGSSGVLQDDDLSIRVRCAEYPYPA